MPLPLTDFGPNTGSGGLWGTLAMGMELGAAAGGVRGVLRLRAAHANTTAIGGGAVHLWVKSSTPNVDFLATVSEVRPDGNETFVQNGWLRASERKLATN